MPLPVVIDFETDAIAPRPDYPPKLVGVALYYPGQKPKYLAWGHPEQNNVTVEQAQRELQGLWKSDRPLLFHNAPFDLEVGAKHLGLPIPDWRRVHDTLYLLFLDDPHATSLSLKPAAERLLGMPPEEANAVQAWLVKSGLVKYSDRKWGRYIGKAPGKLVGEYAIGDVVRTRKLFDLLLPRIQAAGAESAYDRERRLMPFLLKNEQSGIRVDYALLSSDISKYRAALLRADAYIRERLGVKDLNVDSNDELAYALDKAGLVTDWVLTATGKRSTAKKNLTPDKIGDPLLASALGYRNRLTTCLGTFMEPWYETATNNNGYIYTRWNQVRQTDDRDADRGTRTGRLSCSPNFQNIPKDWYDKDDGFKHPTGLRLPELPLIRRYLLPDEGHVFLHRDYNQQELRILAHFEDDRLLMAYKQNPRLDVHTFMQNEINTLTGLNLPRRPVKILNFGIMYGMGNGKLAAGMRVDVETAIKVRNAQRTAIPGLRNLDYTIKRRAASKEPIFTWGGRPYLPEPPKVINGQMRSFEYKLLNYLIQGSASDCTKEAVIRYHEAAGDSRFLVTVHDEINISAPLRTYKKEMQRLREAMESIEFDLPMLTDGKFGQSWGNLTDYPEK